MTGTVKKGKGILRPVDVWVIYKNGHNSVGARVSIDKQVFRGNKIK